MQLLQTWHRLAAAIEIVHTRGIFSTVLGLDRLRFPLQQPSVSSVDQVKFCGVCWRFRYFNRSYAGAFSSWL